MTETPPPPACDNIDLKVPYLPCTSPPLSVSLFVLQIDESYTRLGGPTDDTSYQKSLRRPNVPGKMPVLFKYRKFYTQHVFVHITMVYRR